jgi:hypothetical protein
MEFITEKTMEPKASRTKDRTESAVSISMGVNPDFLILFFIAFSPVRRALWAGRKHLSFSPP